jgi:transcriptional regulator with XRE-family HTH domain
MSLIEAMTKYQQAKGLTDSELARLIGVHPSTLCRIKSGQRKPNLKFLWALREHCPGLTNAVDDYLGIKRPFWLRLLGR